MALEVTPKQEKKEVQKTIITIAILLGFTLLAACEQDDGVTAPSFLHLDAIDVAPSTASGIGHGDAGFYTSDIVAAYVVAHYPGEMKLDTIGLFRMPFTVPVLRDGDVDYFDIFPAVEMSGVSLALPFYTFYNKIRVSDTVMHVGDTLNLGTLSTTYNPLTDIPMLYEPFEPTEASLTTDTVVEWVRHDREGACVGEGYGRVTVSTDKTSVPFGIDNYFYLADPTKVCYLEIDIKTTHTVEVYMHAAYTTGGVEERLSVMRINPNDRWTHFYINLGRTWSEFNHATRFRLSFASLNPDGTSGETLIDNIKVLSTNVVL